MYSPLGHISEWTADQGWYKAGCTAEILCGHTSGLRGSGVVCTGTVVFWGTGFPAINTKTERINLPYPSDILSFIPFVANYLKYTLKPAETHSFSAGIS